MRRQADVSVIWELIQQQNRALPEPALLSSKLQLLLCILPLSAGCHRMVS